MFTDSLNDHQMISQNPFSGLGKQYDENKVKFQEKIKISK